MGPDSWPYTLYQYDSAADQYLVVNTAAAWSKEVSDVYYDGVNFPDEVDADRDGVVYILENYKTDSDIPQEMYLDQDEYEEWYKGVCILRHPSAGFAEQNGHNTKLIGHRPLLL